MCEVAARDRQRCRDCGTKLDRHLSLPQLALFHRRTLELDGPGEAVTVESRRQLIDECRRRGKVHRGYMYHDREMEYGASEGA